MVATPESRKIFIDDSIKFLRKWKFDGLDLDWEYPGDNARTDDPDKRPENKHLFTLLCEVNTDIGLFMQCKITMDLFYCLFIVKSTAYAGRSLDLP